LRAGIALAPQTIIARWMIMSSMGKSGLGIAGQSVDVRRWPLTQEA
jgi:hypothetical protein